MSLKTIVAAVAGGIAHFVAGYLIFGLGLSEYLKGLTVPHPGLFKDPPNVIAIGLSSLIWGLLLAIIFDHWANIRTLAGGALAGAIVMFLVDSAFQMQIKAFMILTIGYMPVIVHVLGSTILGAISGGVVGLVLGLMNKQPAAAEE